MEARCVTCEALTARVQELEAEAEHSRGRANEEINNRERSQIHASQCERATARMALELSEAKVRVQELERLANEKADIAMRLLNENALLKNSVDLIEPMGDE